MISVDGSLMAGSTVTLDTTNSALNYPRTRVQWDLTGSGTYSTPGGTAVSTTLPLTATGTQTVGVRITTADGTVVTGTTSFVVGSPTASAGPAPAPLTAASPVLQQTAPLTAAPIGTQATGTTAAHPVSASGTKPVSVARATPRARTVKRPRVRTKAAGVAASMTRRVTHRYAGRPAGQHARRAHTRRRSTRRR